MVVVLRKDIMRLIMSERIIPRVCMHQLSRRERAMHDTEEARKSMGGESVNFRILTLVRRTHALIIGNSHSN